MKNTKELIQEASRELNDDLGYLWMNIQTLEGAKEFLYDITNELDREIQRGNATYREKKLDLKLSAIYELMNYSIEELSEYEKEASKQSDKIFGLFADKKTESPGGDI